MQSGRQIGVPVRVFDAATGDDLGIAHVPFPVELGDELALEGRRLPLEVVALLETNGVGEVAALVEVRDAAV